MDKSRFVSSVSLAQDALVRVRDANGKLTAADISALQQLAAESRKIGAEIGSGDPVLPGEAYLRDTPIADPSQPGLALTGRAWNIADEWKRNIEIAYAKDAAGVAKETTASDGLYWLAALCDEIVARPNRKTAGGLAPGKDFPQGTPPWGEEVVSNSREALVHLKALRGL